MRDKKLKCRKNSVDSLHIPDKNISVSKSGPILANTKKTKTSNITKVQISTCKQRYKFGHCSQSKNITEYLVFHLQQLKEKA